MTNSGLNFEMADSPEDLVKMTVNLRYKAHEAMEAAAGLTGDTRTDTVNRALALYAMLVRTALDGDGTGRVGFDLTDEYRADLRVTRVRKREIAPRA